MPSPALPPAAHVRASDRPAAVWLRAGLWLLAGGVALVLPFAVLVAGERPAARGFWWDFSIGMGFAALALVAMQFALTGRLRPLTQPFGADIVYVFHRFLSWGAVALMGGHFAVLYVRYQHALGELNPLTARWELTAARLALLCFVLLVLTSELRQRIKLPYRAWRLAHVGLAVVGFAAAVAHVLGVGQHTATPEKRVLWLAVTLAWVALLLYTRVLRPWRLARNPWTVTANTAERGDVHTLTLKPQGAPLRGWRPGQFAWLSIDASPFALREHPFTISTAPERGPELQFSIKPLGDDTAHLVQTPVGTTAYVDGPYGVFSVDREASAGGFVMIGGGVGITPLLSNLHALHARGDQRPVVLLYFNEQWDEVSFREELAELATEMPLTVVHVLNEPPDGWQGETGLLDQDLLSRHLGEHTRDWPHLLCGPAPLLDAASQALRALGVPRGRLESEIFEMV
ncbi:MAG: ferredoxin reductase family protein [Pseudomonadota bacterium]|nr:ferredoxin reductase family protein [Pseudomonadota bacterium]